MIERREKKDGVTVYYVSKDFDNAKLEKLMNKKLKRTQIKTIIDDDADVYTTEGKLLLRFRKAKLNKEHVDAFYDNVIDFAMIPTTNRGIASGSKKKNIYDNPPIMTNILGYFDKLSPRQKYKYNLVGKKMPKITARETRFMTDYPEQFKRLIPLVREIDKYYKQYAPDHYAKQKRKANQTPYHIADTAFTTITTNVNWQTAVHQDKGDDAEGFGNLAVIEHGHYTGGETCFPQYGIGVDVRTGDVLYMDVHQAHGNLPVVLGSRDTIRLSIVCYLRKSVWEQTRGKTKKFMEKHSKTMQHILKTKQGTQKRR